MYVQSVPNTNVQSIIYLKKNDPNFNKKNVFKFEHVFSKISGWTIYPPLNPIQIIQIQRPRLPFKRGKLPTSTTKAFTDGAVGGRVVGQSAPAVVARPWPFAPRPHQGVTEDPDVKQQFENT